MLKFAADRVVCKACVRERFAEAVVLLELVAQAPTEPHFASLGMTIARVMSADGKSKVGNASQLGMHATRRRKKDPQLSRLAKRARTKRWELKQDQELRRAHKRALWVRWYDRHKNDPEWRARRLARARAAYARTHKSGTT